MLQNHGFVFSRASGFTDSIARLYSIGCCTDRCANLLMMLQDISGRPTEELDHSSFPQLQPEEGDQPSPVSILQTSFHDEFSSSSNCFESLSADLQGISLNLLNFQSLNVLRFSLHFQGSECNFSYSKVSQLLLITREPCSFQAMKRQIKRNHL